eukprot:TRINITY_DN10234_c0_g1_i3.p1 TRINITY_DN10234_c0_g1~~TRINITY_DN10234_c0_g1_i3.p1  ORF type:complete len:724 (-),score=85.49 TRINITY_DN10234_c0_g1_i3:44-2185(-)
MVSNSAFQVKQTVFLRAFQLLVIVHFFCDPVVSVQSRQLLQQQDVIPQVKTSYRGFQKESSIADDQTVDAEVLVSLRGGQSDYRVPIAVTLIVDGSESLLSDEADKRVRQTLDFIAQNLVETDFVGLTIFDYQARDALSLSRVGLGDIVANFTNAVQAINPQGGTNLQAGIERGLSQQTNLQVTGQIVQAIVLFSDGKTNVGVVDQFELVTTVRNFIEENENVNRRTIITYAISAGFRNDELLLEAVGDVTNGGFYSVTNTDEIERAYGIVFGTLLTTYYEDLQVEFNTDVGVEVTQVNSGALIQQGAQVGFTDLAAQERRDIIYSLKVQPGKANSTTVDSTVNLGTVKVGYTNNGVLQDQQLVQSFDVAINSTILPSNYEDPAIKVSRTRQDVARTFSDVKFALSENNFDNATQNIQQIDQQVQEIKSGGILEQLQNAPESQEVEAPFESEGRRKLLQFVDEVEDIVAYNTLLFELIEQSIQDVQRAIQIIKQDPEKDENIKLIYCLIAGLSNTYKDQRLQVLDKEGFNSTRLMQELFGTDAQLDAQQLQSPQLQQLPQPPYEVPGEVSGETTTPDDTYTEVVDEDTPAPVSIFVPDDGTPTTITIPETPVEVPAYVPGPVPIVPLVTPVVTPGASLGIVDVDIPSIDLPSIVDLTPEPLALPPLVMPIVMSPPPPLITGILPSPPPVNIIPSPSPTPSPVLGISPPPTVVR